MHTFLPPPRELLVAVGFMLKPDQRVAFPTFTDKTTCTAGEVHAQSPVALLVDTSRVPQCPRGQCALRILRSYWSSYLAT